MAETEWGDDDEISPANPVNRQGSMSGQEESSKEHQALGMEDSNVQHDENGDLGIGQFGEQMEKTFFPHTKNEGTNAENAYMVCSAGPTRSTAVLEETFEQEMEEKPKGGLKITGLSDEEDQHAEEIRSTATSPICSDKEEQKAPMRTDSSILASNIGGNDVILGRAGRLTVTHEGNNRLRALVDLHKEKYQKSLSKQEKTTLSRAIVNNIRARGGRFLALDRTKGVYKDATDHVAREKVSHMLRAKQTNKPKRIRPERGSFTKKKLRSKHPPLDQASFRGLLQSQQKIFSEMRNDSKSKNDSSYSQEARSEGETDASDSNGDEESTYD